MIAPSVGASAPPLRLIPRQRPCGLLPCRLEVWEAPLSVEGRALPGAPRSPGGSSDLPDSSRCTDERPLSQRHEKPEKPERPEFLSLVRNSVQPRVVAELSMRARIQFGPVQKGTERWTRPSSCGSWPGPECSPSSSSWPKGSSTSYRLSSIHGGRWFVPCAARRRPERQMRPGGSRRRQWGQTTFTQPHQHHISDICSPSLGRLGDTYSGGASGALRSVRSHQAN